MEFDLEDTWTSFQEHNSDTIPDLFDSESDHMPSRNSTSRYRNRDFYVSFRSEAVSLVMQAQFSCNFEPFISYLAVNYLDRYVSKQEIPPGKPWILRLLVFACLSLAAKMKNSPLSLSDIQREDGTVFDAQTVHKMELLILDTLSWRMRSITPFSFLSFFASFFELNENDARLMQALKDRASEIIFSSQSDIEFLEFKPSIIAASALLSASHQLFFSQFPCLKASLSACQYIKSENLWKCFNMMQENALITMQDYGSNLDRVLLSSPRTPMSVLERKFTNSEIISENFTTTTTNSTAQQCDNLVSEKEENKRPRVNGLCGGSGTTSTTTTKSHGFKISQFHHH